MVKSANMNNGIAAHAWHAKHGCLQRSEPNLWKRKVTGLWTAPNPHMAAHHTVQVAALSLLPHFTIHFTLTFFHFHFCYYY